MASGRIKQDEKEFWDIFMRRLRKDLLGFLRQGHITIMGPGRGVALPVREIEIPRLHFAELPDDIEVQDDEDQEGSGGQDKPGPDIGIAQGPGQPGDDLGPVPQDGEGEGDGEGGEKTAGQGRGKNVFDVEVPMDEFFELFKDILELPRIKPKGNKSILSQENKYTDIRRTGAESLLHKKRTVMQALRRQIGEGTYDPENPRIIITGADKRYRVQQIITKPKNNALVIFAMDVSGSMGTEERKIVRYFCALVEFWLAANYDGVKSEWIIHDGEADRVTKEEFFTTQRGGGTVISSAHNLMLEIIDKDYPPSEWNIYPIYLSDGFNWGGDDDICMQLIEEKLLPIVNQYSHAEVQAFWGRGFGDPEEIRGAVGDFVPAGSFGRMLQSAFSDNDLVAVTNLKSMEEVPDAIKVVFKKGN